VIDAGLDHGAAGLDRAVEIGVAGAEVADESGAVFITRAGEGLFDTVHRIDMKVGKWKGGRIQRRGFTCEDRRT